MNEWDALGIYFMIVVVAFIFSGDKDAKGKPRNNRWLRRLRFKWRRLKAKHNI